MTNCLPDRNATGGKISNTTNSAGYDLSGFLSQRTGGASGDRRTQQRAAPGTASSNNTTAKTRSMLEIQNSGEVSVGRCSSSSSSSVSNASAKTSRKKTKASALTSSCHRIANALLNPMMKSTSPRGLLCGQGSSSQHTLETVDTAAEYESFACPDDKDDETLPSFALEDEEDDDDVAVDVAVKNDENNSNDADDDDDVSMSFEELLNGPGEVPRDDSSSCEEEASARTSSSSSSPSLSNRVFDADDSADADHQCPTPRFSNKRSAYSLYLSSSRRRSALPRFGGDGDDDGDGDDHDDGSSATSSSSLHQGDGLWDLIKDEWRGAKSIIQVRSKPPTYRPYIELNIEQMILNAGGATGRKNRGGGDEERECASDNDSDDNQLRTTVQRRWSQHVLDQRLHSSDPHLRYNMLSDQCYRTNETASTKQCTTGGGGTSRRRRKTTTPRDHDGNRTTRELLMQSQRLQYSSPNLNYGRSSPSCENSRCKNSHQEEDEEQTSAAKTRNPDGDSTILGGGVDGRRRQRLRRSSSHDNVRTALAATRQRSVPIDPVGRGVSRANS